MTIDNVTETTIAAAAQHADLDDAVRAVQDSAGINDGGIAGIFFDNSEYDTWPAMTREERANRLRQYVAFERSVPA